MTQTLDIYETTRPQLYRLAYRMLGTSHDAEDVLQDAYIKWAQLDLSDIKLPSHYLVRMVSRLCLDQRRKVDVRKQTYIGQWLPEPLLSPYPAPGSQVTQQDEVSLAMLNLMESLSPQERLAYLLREIFLYEYEQIAEILEKSEANCRQMVSRASQHLAEKKKRFQTDRREIEALTNQFITACTTGNLDTLIELMSDQIVLYADGGGKVTAARIPVVGLPLVTKFLGGLFKKYYQYAQFVLIDVNGEPGIAVYSENQITAIYSLLIVDNKIEHIYTIRNPDKIPAILL
jgi:RNA polymerase sigma-70 factor (ECF subfamily)